jgi:phage terminase Nu1 subunit (DNA packaging protein)
MGVTADQIVGWTEEGMPCEFDDGQMHFDGEEVRKWLVGKGYAEARTLLTSRAAVGKHFGGACERTVAMWIARGMPVEKRGGKAFYDADKIAVWLPEHVDGWKPHEGNGEEGGGETRQDADRRHAISRADERQMKVGRLRGELLELDSVVRFYVQSATHGRTLLEQIPDRLMRIKDLSPKRFREEAVRAVSGVMELLHKRFMAEARRLDPELTDEVMRELGDEDEPEG